MGALGNSEKPPSRGQKIRGSISNQRKKRGGSSKKRLALGAGIFFGPTLIGLMLFLIAFQAGFALEHISRITGGLRFGALHLNLSRRLNHVRRDYLRTAYYTDEIEIDSRVSRYTKTTLGARMLGVTPHKLMGHLEAKGYRFKHGTFKGGGLLTKGRRTATKAYLPDGTVKEIKSSKDMRALIKQVNVDLDDGTAASRFRATRASFLLAKKSGLPFMRFMTIIDGLRSGSLKNTVRGSPKAMVELVNESIIDGKNRIGKRLPKLRNSFRRLGIEGNIADAKNSLTQNKSLRLGSILGEITSGFDTRQKILFGASAASIAVSLMAFACILRELSTLIRGAFKMKVRGLQDTAAYFNNHHQSDESR